MRITNIKLLIVIFIFLYALTLNGETVYFIPKTDITEMIDLSFANLIKRTVKKAEEEGASTIIIELNTPGGRVDAALRTTGILLSTKLKTVVFINHNAISAGALISLSAEKIFIIPGGVIGASTPVYQKGGKMETAEEKMISVMRAEMRSCAERYGRSAKIAEAMVDPDIELTKSEDGIDLAKGKLLTLTAKEALKLKIADHMVKNLEEVLKILKLENATVIKAVPTSMDRAISFLTFPIVSGILLTLGMLGLIFEVKTAGWGVGGTIGILSLALFFVSQILAGYANWGAIVLFLVGLILLIAEIFIIPGFGIVGISGIAVIVASFFMSFQNFEIALYTIFLAMVVTGVVTYFMFKYLPRTTVFSRLVLETSEMKNIGYHASPESFSNLEGKQGMAITTLRPAGKAKIDGQLIDVMSEGDFIKKGDKIKILKVEGNRILVRKI